MSLLIQAILLANTVKVAFVHHGNQHISDNGSYALRPGDEGYVGNSYHNVIDTHEKYNIPVDLHMSGVLMQSYAWMQNDNGLLQRMATSPVVELVGGSYSEHIMPYAEEDMNIFSMMYAKKLAESLVKPFGAPGRPIVCWVPERVWKDEFYQPDGTYRSMVDEFARVYGKWEGGTWIPPCIIVDGDTAHAWYHGGCTGYTDSGWDIGQNRIHVNWDSYGHHVLVAFIDRIAADSWVSAYGWDRIRSHAAELRATGRDDLVILYGDDWEKAAGVAGWDGSMWGAPNPGGPSRTYDANIACLAAYKDYEGLMPIHLSEAALWYGVWGNPPSIEIPYTSYPYIQEWTGGNYDYWYNDWLVNYGKESVYTTQAYGCENAPDVNNNGIKGDYEDLWKFAYNALKNNKATWEDNPIEYVGWITLLAEYYETGWHDAWGSNMSGWEKNLLNHTRHGAVYAYGADWLEDVKAGKVQKAHLVVKDYDGDGVDEYCLYNDKIFCVFEKIGGRMLWMFTKDGDVVVGNSMSNWWGEGDWDDGIHPGVFHDSLAWNQEYDVSLGPSEGDQVWVKFSVQTSWGTSVSKMFILNMGVPYIEARYEVSGDNWSVGGFSPGIKEILEAGYVLESISGTMDFKNKTYNYIGCKNLVNGAVICYIYPSGVEGYDRGKYQSLAEKVELHFWENVTFYVYAGRAMPSEGIDTVAPAPVTDIKVERIRLDAVKISWTPPATDEEGNPLQDLYKFRIYRATEKGALGILIGETTENYFIDESVDPGKKYYYYVTALDQSFNESAVPSEFAEASIVRLLAYPNPVVGSKTVKIGLLPSEVEKVEVFDLNGRQVAVSGKEIRIEGGWALWEPEVPAGIYFFVVKGAGKTSTGKLVIVK